jgi:protoporphyrinogen oxidase
MNNNSCRKKDIVILGAGLAGLSTAYHLRHGYTLFEKETEPGGMARSIYKDGYIFDYDGHLLHFRKEYTFSLVSELLDGNIAPHKRNSWIYSNGSYTRYPFQANLYGLPKNVVKDCLIGLIKAKADSHGTPIMSENFATWLKKTFGYGITEYFMLPYNRKFWTIEPRELMCDWLDGFIPVPTLEDTIAGAISTNTKSYGYNSRFWYPIKGGISEVVEGFLQRINSLYLNKKAVTIDQRRKEVIFEDGTIKTFDKLVTTIPLPELFKILTHIPAHVKKAFLSLRFTSILVINLGIKRDDITDRHWIYYPEDNVVFYRTGFPTNFSMDVAPPKRTSIYAEVSYPGVNDIENQKVIDNTVKTLKALGIIGNENEIEICLPINIKYGYVIYDIDRNRAVHTIKNYLKHLGIYSIGRYGSWKYMSMEDVILEGKETAECLLIS